MTEFKNDVSIVGDLTINGPDDGTITMQAPSTGTDLIFGYDTSGAPNAWTCSQSGLGFYFVWGFNAVNPQIILGAPTGAGTAFLDTDFARPLNINTLPTGTGQGVGGRGLVTVGQAGLSVGSLDATQAPNLQLTTVDGSTDYNIFCGSPGVNDGSLVFQQTGGNNLLEIESDGTLNVSGTTDYELLVLDDDDIPNKKYLDDAITASAGAGALQFEWRFDTSLAGAPATGRIAYDNVLPASVTEIRISDVADNGVDINNILAAIEIGDRMYFQTLNDGTEFILVDVTGITDNTTYYTFDVNVEDSGTLPSNNEKMGGILVLGSSTVLSIDDLTDVDTSTISPVLGNLLYWDNTNWVPTESTADRIVLLQGSCIADFIDTTGLDFCNTQVGPTAGSAFYVGRRALGAIDAETAITSGTKIAGYSAAGYDGTAYYVTSEISFFATETFNATDGGAEVRFLNTPNGTKTANLNLTIEQDGTLNVAGQTDYETKVTDDDDIPNLKRITDLRSRGYVVTNGGSDNTINYNTVGYTKVQYNGTSDVSGTGITWNAANDSFDVTFTGRVRLYYNNPWTTTQARGALEGVVTRDRSAVLVNQAFSYGYTRNSGTDVLRASCTAFTEFDCISGDQFYVRMQRMPSGTGGAVHNLVEIAEFMIERIDNG